MPGMEVITAANMLSEIGDINRFPKANKQAKLAGICPINFSSAEKREGYVPVAGKQTVAVYFTF